MLKVVSLPLLFSYTLKLKVGTVKLMAGKLIVHDIKSVVQVFNCTSSIGNTKNDLLPQKYHAKYYSQFTTHKLAKVLNYMHARQSAHKRSSNPDPLTWYGEVCAGSTCAAFSKLGVAGLAQARCLTGC